MVFVLFIVPNRSKKSPGQGRDNGWICENFMLILFDVFEILGHYLEDGNNFTEMLMTIGAFKEDLKCIGVILLEGLKVLSEFTKSVCEGLVFLLVTYLNMVDGIKLSV